jgi:uncharacterized membrane protein YesL
MRISHELYDKVFGTIYLGMLGNLLVAVACSPVLIVAFTTDPNRTWPLLAVASPLCAPAAVACFAMFTHFSEEGPVALVSTFVRVWRRSFRRAFAVGGAVSFVVVVLSVDATAAGRSHATAIAIPLLLMLDVLVVAIALLALVGLSEQPTARIRDIVRPAAFLAVRRWYLTALSLLVLGALGSIVAARPIVGLGLATAPMLYIVWANGRFTLQPILHSDAR